MIRYVTSDEEPHARIVVEPVSKPNVDTEIKIDQHLVALGVKLSKNDVLQRYVRTEADQNDTEDAPLVGTNSDGWCSRYRSAASRFFSHIQRSCKRVGGLVEAALPEQRR